MVDRLWISKSHAAEIFCYTQTIRRVGFNLDALKLYDTRNIQDIHIDSIMTFLRQINLVNNI